ncbi:MAG TPA: hypothetical protein VMR19_00765 [Candidatus Saccharimonadales bacterium]|nr:hypothetical protein [Candidatus Saccharimonadales bacterium]
MPEIDIGTDSHEKAEFVFQTLSGEDLTTLRKTNVLVSTSMSYIRSYRRAQGFLGAGEDKLKAIEKLGQILPYDTAEKLVQAVLDNKIGAKATFAFRGTTENEGFELQSLEIPEDETKGV